MLERISNVQGIGLLHEANGIRHACQKVTLIYADNGRGKSTLATIFRSASTGDSSLISARKTVDATLPPKVVLQFGSGHKVTFENNSWSESRSELTVFDADFVERNVHSGGAVSTGHRKNLLEFALGEAAVAARESVDEATTASRLAAENVQRIVTQLSGYHAGTPLIHFEQFPQIVEVDTKITDLQNRLHAANSIATIQARSMLNSIQEPSFDIDGFFSVLGLSLENVHADAERIVKEHTDKLGKNGSENWLSQGQQFETGDSCPYCNQDISLNDLVRAYQTHFNAAYTSLKLKTSSLQGIVKNSASEIIVHTLQQSLEVITAQNHAWAENVQLPIISFDADSVRKELILFREFVVSLVMQKIASPTEPIGSTDDKAQAISFWEKVIDPIRSVNLEIKAANLLIETFKAKLNSEDIPSLQQQLTRCNYTKKRYDATVVALIESHTAAKIDVIHADGRKKAAREKLDALMTSTLKKYQVSINHLLKKFGASFSIKDMSANFRGNAPRSEYGLLLRGKDVALEGGAPSFSTVLSEGDKRTLAFAFFIASTLDDPKIDTRTVVIDDPMCSLDMNRRHHTRTVLKTINSKAAQLIVLAHDAYFLRDFRDALRKENNTLPIVFFQLKLAPNDYTDFEQFDVDKECESNYSKHHRLLSDFSGGHGGDSKLTAVAIRLMLEGYLHRRFPRSVPKNLLFGQIVTLIRNSVAPSPLHFAKNLLTELDEINDYAGQFHHDTNPDADSVVISPSELKTYSLRALDLVHKCGPP